MDTQFLQNVGIVTGVLTALVAPVMRWCWNLQAKANQADWERAELQRANTQQATLLTKAHEEIVALQTRIARVEYGIERQSEILRTLQEMSAKINELQSSIASLRNHE